MTPPSDREKEITSALKHTSEETVQAALRFQHSRSPDDLDIIIRNVLKRDLPEDVAGNAETATDESRLVEDLGMDSFGTIEVMMTAEEVFGITIANSEMKDVATIGQLKQFLLAKMESNHPLAPAPEPAPASSLS